MQREDEQRLYQQSGGLRYGLKPVPGTTVGALDLRRLRDYFERVVDAEGSFPEDPDERAGLLVNLEFAVATAGRTVPTVDGILLFGRNPKRTLPQSGVRALCYPEKEPDYATRADEDLKGPLVPLLNEEGTIIEAGLVDQAWDFVRRNTTPSAHLEGNRRVDHWEYPESVIREAIGNALVHRDYSIVGTDVMLAIYSNRLEVVSPGRLPNTVTPEGMRSGDPADDDQGCRDRCQGHSRQGDSSIDHGAAGTPQRTLANILRRIESRLRGRLVLSLYKEEVFDRGDREFQ